MSILSSIFSSYGDDLAKAASKIATKGASSYSDDFIKKYGEQIVKAGADKSDDAMRKLLTKRGNKYIVGDAFMSQADLGTGTDLAKVFREYGGDKNSWKKAL